MINERRKALLEAALLCSRYADRARHQAKRDTARHLAREIEKLADSSVHFYPPGKPVIDGGQDSENSF